MSLKQKAKEKGFTLTKLSEETGISITYLSYINNGKKKNPSLDVLQKLSKCLKIPADEVIKLIKKGVS